MLGNEYGYPWNTNDYIFTRTRREIDLRLRAIYKRHDTRAREQIVIHRFAMSDLDVNTLNPDSKPAPQMSIEQQEAVNKSKQMALERIKARHEGKQI